MTIYPTVITIDQRSIFDDYEFDAASGMHFGYIDVIDDDVDDHFAASRVWLPVEIGPLQA